MTANDNNDVALLAEVFRFLLPRPRRITYCIKNSGVCIGFFEKLRTFLPFCYLKCGLCNRKNGFWGSEGPFQAFNSSRSLKTNTSPRVCPTMPCTSGWVSSPATSSTAPSASALAAMFWIFFTKGQVASWYDQAALLQRIVNAAGHAVAADDDLVPGGDVIHVSATIAPRRSMSATPAGCG